MSSGSGGRTVLILQNATAEGPGTMGDHLRASDIPFTIVDLQRGEPIPDLGPFSHLVILGGPMAVYERDALPYLQDEVRVIERAVAGGRRILGICLGSQLLAHVLGARVYSGGTREIGWGDVQMTTEGMQDPCMRELSVDGMPVATVFQWHGDTFDLPPGAVRLAASAVYPNQAFRYTDRVYALQFHIEVSPQIVRGWLEREPGVDMAAIDARSRQVFDPFVRRVNSFYRRIFSP